MKQKDEFQKNPHGYYECYIKNGDIWAHRKDGDFDNPEFNSSAGCYFTPPSGVNFVNVYYLDQANKIYYNTQEPIFNLDMNLIGGPIGFLRELICTGTTGDDVCTGAWEAEKTNKIIDLFKKQFITDTGNVELDNATLEDTWNIGQNTFKAYVEVAHPDAKTYGYWYITDFATIPVTLFVAW